MISIDGLAVEFGGTTLFSDISFVINEKDRIALMGKNGAGKSTLLKILAGVRQPTRGKVSAPKDCVIAYLPQHLMTEDGRTVFEETAQAFAHLHEMEAEIDRLNKELETRTDYESDSYMELIEQVSALSEKYYAIDATNYEEDVEKTLLGLGFERTDFNRPTSDFSGGWRMRIELAKLLLQKPDVLLLDEPTNHLDIESIQWLEDFLISNGKAVVVISHDRKTPRTAAEGLRRATEIHRRNKRVHRTLQGHLLQDSAGTEPREDVGEAGAARSGRGRHLGPAPQVPPIAPLGQLPRHHGRRGQDVWRSRGIQERNAHHRTRRQGGLRGPQR